MYVFGFDVPVLFVFLIVGVLQLFILLQLWTLWRRLK